MIFDKKFLQKVKLDWAAPSENWTHGLQFTRLTLCPWAIGAQSLTAPAGKKTIKSLKQVLEIVIQAITSCFDEYFKWMTLYPIEKQLFDQNTRSRLKQHELCQVSCLHSCNRQKTQQFKPRAAKLLRRTSRRSQIAFRETKNWLIRKINIFDWKDR